MNYQPIHGVKVTITFDKQLVASHLAYHFEQFLLMLFTGISMLPSLIKELIKEAAADTWEKTTPVRNDLLLLKQAVVDRATHTYKEHVVSPRDRLMATMAASYQKVITQTFTAIAPVTQ